MPETPRETYLSYAEFARLDRALAVCAHQQAADANRLLAWTGSRLSEVRLAVWDEFYLEAGT